MKKRITLIELKQQNPLGYKKLLLALNRNRVKTSEKTKNNKATLKNQFQIYKTP